METGVYYKALADGNSKPLEELARKTGYDIEFNIGNALDRLPETLDLRPFRVNIRLPFQEVSADRRLSPKTYWFANYDDKFTFLRTDGSKVRIVDCWVPRKPRIISGETSSLGFLVGELDASGYSFVSKRDGIEAAQLICIQDCRSRYPPLSTLQILTGPTPVMAYVKATSIAAALLMPSIIQSQSNVSMWYTYSIAIAVAIVINATLFYEKYSMEGNRFFSSSGIKVGEKAIDILVREAETVGNKT